MPCLPASLRCHMRGLLCRPCAPTVSPAGGRAQLALTPSCYADAPPFAATTALETLQQLVKEQNAALGKLKVQASEQAANAKRLQERYDAADHFASVLRCEPRVWFKYGSHLRSGKVVFHLRLLPDAADHFVSVLRCACIAVSLLLR